MAIRKRPFNINRPLYGYNASDDVLALGRFEFSIIKNCHLSEDGIPYSRLGGRLLNETALNGAVTGIFDFRRPSGTGTTQELVIKAGELLYSMDMDTLVMTELVDMNTTDRPSFCVFQDSSDIAYLFIADGTNFYKYDGTDVTVVSASYPWTQCAPRYIYVYDDRMLAAGCDSDPYKIYVSGILDGTNWLPGAGDVAVNWTIKSPQGDRVSGLGTVYDYGVIFQQFGTSIITEADPDSTTSKQIKVSNEYGTSSHWSIRNVGNVLYFSDESHIYRGVLRAAVENGLDVMPIDKNVVNRYQQHQGASNNITVYDAEHKELQFAVRTPTQGGNGETLVYNIGRSGPQGELGQVDVWSGWFEGEHYEPLMLAEVLHTTTKYDLNGDPYTAQEMKIYRGDSDGYVYVMEEPFQYKDEYYDAETLDGDIEYTLLTGPIYPGGLGYTKRARDFVIMLYQKHDESCDIYWIIDGRVLSSAVTSYGNIIPYWSEDVQGEERQKWGNTIWGTRYTLPKAICINSPFNYIQFKIQCDGENESDFIAFSGGELHYQIHPVRRIV